MTEDGYVALALWVNSGIATFSPLMIIVEVLRLELSKYVLIDSLRS